MASNPYVNKVQKADGTVIMDLSSDTVTQSDVLNGVSFHDRSGAGLQGNLITHNVYDDLDSTSASDALSAKQGNVLYKKIGPACIKKINNNSVSNITYKLQTTTHTFPVFLIVGTNGKVINETIQVFVSSIEDLYNGASGYSVNPVFVSSSIINITIKGYGKVMIICDGPFTITAIT